MLAFCQKHCPSLYSYILKHTEAQCNNASSCQAQKCRATLHCHSITTPPQALPAGKGNRKKIDVGFVNKKAFLNMCSGGFGTEATKKTDQGLKAVLGKASYFITGMQSLVLEVPHDCTGRQCCSHSSSQVSCISTGVLVTVASCMNAEATSAADANKKGAADYM